MAAETIAEAIEKNAKGPARVSVNGLSVESQSIADQIAADQYVKANTAKSRNHRGIAFRALKPGGCG
jgi:hypothetical protein